jgi:type IV secretion system protein VirD4
MIKRSPSSLTVVAWLAGLLFIGSMLYMGFVGWNNLSAATDELAAKGWAKYVQAQPGPGFVVRCFFNLRCGQALNVAWGNPVPESLLYLPFFSIFTLVAVRILGSRFRPPPKDPGEARWADKKDLASYLLDAPGGSPRVGYLGLLESKYLVRPPENLRCAHTLVIGGTGAGKTTRYVNPNLLTDAKEGVSAVVFDLKYPDPKAGFLEAINYFKAWGRPVHPFTPFDPDSVRIPLLADVKTIQDAMDVASAFRPAGGEETEAAFYRNNERQLLAGLVLGVSQEPNPSMYRVYQLLGSGVDELIKYANARPALKPILGTLLELRKDNLTGIATGLMGDLQPFLNPNLNRATSAGPGQALALEAICREPGFLYIGIPQEEIQGGQGQVLLRLIKRVLDRAILNVCGQNEGRLPVHLSIYLDEFPSFGPLPNIAENLATMRSRRVAYHIAMQNLAQGQAIYGREEFAGMINNNFAQMVVFPRSLRLEDAQFFAEIFGETTATEMSTSRMQTGSILTANPFGEVRRAQSIKEVKRFLLSSEAMRTFPDGFAVIETIGSPPAKVEMPRLDQKQNPYSSVYARIKKTYAVPQLRKPGVFAATSEASPAATSTNPLPVPPAPVNPSSAPNPFAESFRVWFGSLIERNIAMRVEMDGDKPVMVAIERRDLEPLPTDLAQWVEKGWVSDGDRVLIPHLGLSRVTKFWAKLTEHARTQPARDAQVPKSGSDAPRTLSGSSKPSGPPQTARRESESTQRAAPRHQDADGKPAPSKPVPSKPAPNKPALNGAASQQAKPLAVTTEKATVPMVLEPSASVVTSNVTVTENAPPVPMVSSSGLEPPALEIPSLNGPATELKTEPPVRPRPPRIGAPSQAVKK